MRGDILATSAATMALLIPTGASAQQAEQQQPQVAEQCMADIREFGQQATETGYGTVGPPGYGARAPVGG